MRPTSRAALLVILAAGLFGASAPLSKVLLGGIDPIPLAACLYLGSGSAAWILFTIKRSRVHNQLQEARLSRTDLPWLAGATLAGGIAAPILLLVGLNRTPASTASLLLNFESVATALIALIIFKEAVDKRILAAVGLITVACSLLSWNSGNWGLSLGALGILSACFLWGLDNNLTRHISAKDPLVIVGVKGLAAGGFSLVLAFVLGKTMPSWQVIVLALLVGAICYGLSIHLFILGLRGLGSARSGALFGIAPFVGMLISFLFLRESPQVQFWMALPLMLFGTWLMLSEDHSHAHEHEPLEHSHAHNHTEEHHLHAHEDGVQDVDIIHAHNHFHPGRIHVHPHAPDLHHRHGHTDS